MNAQDSHDLVLRVIAQIAPDVDVGSLDEDRDMRRELDLDSLDFQTLVERIAEETGVQIPETDYPQVRSLRGMAEYVAAAGTPSA
ncbi:MAG: acyl carrier protein [Actinomycetales bacterium]|nr:acyl carrier protein [Actinomycetales bacterium]